MRLMRLATLLGGLILLTVSLTLIVHDARSDRRADLTRQLLTEAGTERARLDEYFERSATIVRQLSENPAFRAFYDDPRPRSEKILDPVAVAEANRALDFLESLYPESIGEACFIDAAGPENARVVRGHVAPPDDLSPDESGAPFFAPTFRLDAGEVYQSEPYVSPDTEEWVLANSTLVPLGGAAGRGMVHFEVTLESFRATAGDPGGGRIRIVDDDGAVLVDSRSPQRVGAPLGHPDQTDLRAPIRALTGADGTPDGTLVESDGQLIALQPLHTGLITPNRWYLAVSAPISGDVLTTFEPPTLAALGGGLLVFGLAIGAMLANERRLRTQASTDALTGLPNRGSFGQAVTAAIRTAERGGSSCAILLLDLDRFKEVNDTLGHHRGDQLLQEAAAHLAQAIRAGDTMARLGGDEFAVLLPDTDEQGAIRAAARLRAALERPTEVEGVPFHIEASTGIAIFPDHGDTIGDLLQRADVAMYTAKRRGAEHAVYTPESDPHSAERLALTAELRAAIDDDQLILHYQPKYVLDGMEVVGLEALVRWSHPQRGVLPPGEFMPLVEVSGLLRPLTNAVLVAALSQVAAWEREGWPVTVAVNVSPRSLGDTEFIPDIERALAASGARPDLITIEITEDSLFSEPEASRSALLRLRSLGFSVSIDDFGTGYSSLSYLRELPIDEIKIDRSFVANLTRSPSDQAIVASTLALAGSLGYRVVAEGIEDVPTLDRLRAMGCDQGQGFLMCRPADATRVRDAALAGAAG